MAHRGAYATLYVESADENQKVERLSFFKKVKEIFMAVLCFIDFVSDILASQSNAHSKHSAIQTLGFLGAGFLLTSVAVNSCILCKMRREHSETWVKLTKTAPLTWQIFRLLASTNPEVLSSFFVLMMDGSAFDEELLLAGMSLKRWGLLSQLFEDIPQFGIQVLSLIVSLMHGWPVTWQVAASVSFTLFMLLFKVIINLLVLALGRSFLSTTIKYAAAHHRVSVHPVPSLSNGLHIIVQAALAGANIFFAACMGPTPLPFGLYAQVIAFLVLPATYIFGVIGALELIRECQQRLWHCRLSLELTAALVALSCIHPAILLQIDPDLPQAACCWTALLFGPLARCVVMGCLSLWAIWKSHFPIAENLCILLAVGNALGALQLILFSQDIQVYSEERHDMPNFDDLERIDEKERKLLQEAEALAKQLPSLRLEDLRELDFATLAPLAARDRRIHQLDMVNQAFNTTRTLKVMQDTIGKLDPTWQLHSDATQQLEAAAEEERKAAEAAAEERKAAEAAAEEERKAAEAAAEEERKAAEAAAEEERKAAEAEAADAKEAAKCRNSIHVAAEDGLLGATRHILRTDPGAVAATGAFGTALHVAAVRGRAEVAQLLLAAKAQVDARNDFGSTPLHLAAYNGYTEVVKLLVEAKASVALKNNSGKTPLNLAQQEGHHEVVTILRNAA